VVDENTPHGAGSHGKKVYAVPPLHASNVHQADVGFVNERRGRKRVTFLFALELAARNAPQLVIDEWKQPVESVAPASPAFEEQRRDG
jgi:hypothetical protein